MSKKIYTNVNVLIASQNRISKIFDDFENIIISVSGGKDSTVLCYLVMQEAVKRKRKVGIFYLDEEVVYKNTIEQIEYLMSLYPENTNRFWLQIPFNLTNSTSYQDSQLKAWNNKDKPNWMRKRSNNNIIRKPWSHKDKIADKNKGFGFYDVFKNFELSFENTAFFVGLRADESLNRYRTMVKNPGYKDVFWSTKKANNNYTFYPIYDWSFSDIWKYIGDNNLKYHKYYDFAFKKGVFLSQMRVSSLTHEKSFHSIKELPEFEFDTYEKLLKRIKGISFAQETAKDSKMFKVQKLPKNFKSWKEYKNFLLDTFPEKEKKYIFEKRFINHLNNEYVARQQCKQLVLNDYENNFPIKNEEDPIQQKIKYWREVL